ncbi:MAG: Acetolactate synthase isozyme 1 large subunit [Alphaproteobacteria bacterium MarineAlpha11_Bin1]|nr:MAG: Acetolactate synthase isozyme 1 large subunit [Alphaproteobacteria bacterium MarineAlpha11_Bin1]|tara:strand:- start:7814 stop:9415 length:1602 start_codon:yes stop_codon:yes gene_type:complete
MNNAELIVQILKMAGTTFGFGIPSGNVLPLMDAMRRHDLPFVLTAHEGSAGFAADVMGRMTNAPGLGIATLGPGATNLATGVGNAWLDRSPMIAITCNLNTDQLGRRIQMYIDHHKLFMPITKATLAIREGSVAETITRAVRISMSEPRGPVHLDLPEDVALALATEPIPNVETFIRVPPASPQAVEEGIELLAAAKRPVAVLGSSAMRMSDPSLLLSFVERHALPFATTTMAKGMIDEDHPLSLGCIERGKRQIQRAFLRSSDLIVGIGYDTIEVEYEAWIGATPLLQIDIDKVDVAISVQVKGEVTGDLDASLSLMVEAPASDNEWVETQIADHRVAFQKALRPASEVFTPHEAIDIVRDLLPTNGILTFDVGAHTHQIASQWTAHAPKTFHISNGWSSMGFGLPAAIAAKLARPNLPVVCILGDGCFQMTCGEIATAKRLGISLPVVVLDDRWLGLIRVKQERRQLPFYGTTLQEEAYQDPPEHYFGVPAVGVRSGEILRVELEKALQREGPTVIEAIVNAEHYSETVFD